MTKRKRKSEHDGKELKFKYRKVDELIPYARNTKIHHPEQITRIAASIKEFGFMNPVIITKDNTIVAGHGRLEAAKKLGMKTVPTVQAEHLTDSQRRAYTIADNRIAEQHTEWDTELLQIELQDLSEEGIDLNDFMSFDDLELPDIEGLMESDSEGEESSGVGYSVNLEIPHYEPKEEKAPPLETLFDEAKTQELQGQIAHSDCPPDIKRFLSVAAQRHTAFRYDRIAEYYCHAPKEVQELMERSALVLIDHEKAVEHGFVRLVGEMKEAFSENPEKSE